MKLGSLKVSRKYIDDIAYQSKGNTKIPISLGVVLAFCFLVQDLFWYEVSQWEIQAKWEQQRPPSIEVIWN